MPLKVTDFSRIGRILSGCRSDLYSVNHSYFQVQRGRGNLGLEAYHGNLTGKNWLNQTSFRLPVWILIVLSVFVLNGMFYLVIIYGLSGPISRERLLTTSSSCWGLQVLLSIPSLVLQEQFWRLSLHWVLFFLPLSLYHLRQSSRLLSLPSPRLNNPWLWQLCPTWPIVHQCHLNQLLLTITTLTTLLVTLRSCAASVRRRIDWRHPISPIRRAWGATWMWRIRLFCKIAQH